MNKQNRGKLLTSHARNVLSLAEEEARRSQHNYIGTEHLLLALIREEEGNTGRIFRELGLNVQKVRSAIEFIIGYGDQVASGKIDLTPRAQIVIELAEGEARRTKQQHIESEHLLLGLIREGEGIAVGVMESLEIDLAQLRLQTLHSLQQVRQHNLKTR